MATSDRPQMKLFAALWSFREHPSAQAEWTLDQKFAEAKRCGFEAVNTRPDPAIPGLCAKHGLEFVVTIDAEGSDYRENLRQARAMNPKRVNVQLCDHDTPPAEAARVWLAMQPIADDLGLQIDLELHRNTATEVPEKAYEIADIFQKATGKTIRFCADFSHFAVVKSLAPPYAPFLLARPDLIAPIRQIHARPFNGHHAQIPATDGAGNLSPEFIPWLAFMDEFFALMLKTATPQDVFYVCAEFGPVVSGYGLSCFPNPWQDQVRTRDELQKLWQKRCGE